MAKYFVAIVLRYKERDIHTHAEWEGGPIASHADVEKIDKEVLGTLADKYPGVTATLTGWQLFEPAPETAAVIPERRRMIAKPSQE